MEAVCIWRARDANMSAMNRSINYIECSIPEGMTINSYRSSRPRPRRRLRLAGIGRGARR
jgi:hypothetical protein